jgi:hypothetical protein
MRNNLKKIWRAVSLHERSFCGCGTEARMGQIRNYRYLQTLTYAEKNRPSHKWKNNFRKYLCTESLWTCEPDKYGSIAGSDMRFLSHIMNRRARRTELHYQLSDFELHKNSAPRGYRATPWANTLRISLLHSTVKTATFSNKWPGNPYSPEITWEGHYISLLLPAGEELWKWLR